ncbi:MAG: hypothetical protein Q4A16_03510 [Lautropia sp.]|nr:hypothetical protein [Lautropia sp.]
MSNKHKILPVSLSLMFALSACGGGGGSTEKAVSATPDAPSNTIVSGDTSNGGSTQTGAGNPSAAASTVALAQAPISAVGVSGAVLAAMLDTRAPDLSMMGSDALPIAQPAANRYGEAIEDSDTPFVSASQQLEPSNYVPLSDDAPFNPYVNDRYAPANGGSRYHASNFVQNRWNISSTAGTPFNAMEMSVGLATTDTTLSLGEVLNLNVGSGGNRSSTTLIASAAYSTAKDDLVPYGQVLQQWNNGLAIVQLMLQQGKDGDEAELCWNVQVPDMIRLVCNSWEVPDDWTPGQPLKLDSYYIEDNRSVYPNEAGTLYWRG